MHYTKSNYYQDFFWNSREASDMFQKGISAITCLKLITETLEQGVEYVQS